MPAEDYPLLAQEEAALAKAACLLGYDPCGAHRNRSGGEAMGRLMKPKFAD